MAIPQSLGKLLVEVGSTWDGKGLDRGRDSVGRFTSTAKTESTKAVGHINSVGGSMVRVGSLAKLALTGVAAHELLRFGKFAFTAASDLNESMSKVNVVFDTSAQKVVDWSKTSATAMGISQQQALEAAGTFGNLFRALGTGIAPAADMSTKLVGLASDLASFNNANPEDVLLALRSGLVGEAEPLRKFGVSLSAARIEAEAFALGLAKPVKNATAIKAAHLAVEKATKGVADAIKKHGKESLEARTAELALEKANQKLAESMKGQKVELNAAQKAQAAYSIIMKDTKLAQGDFGRTAGGAANQMRILKAQFTEVASKIGTKLLPIGTKLMGWLINFFKGISSGSKSLGGFKSVLGRVGSAFSAFGAMIQRNLAAIKGFFNNFVSIIKSLWGAFGDDLLRGVMRNFNSMKTIFAGFFQAIKGIFEFFSALFKGEWGKMWDGLVNIVTGIGKMIWGAIRNIFGGIITILGIVFTPIRALWDKLWGGMSKAVKAVVDGVASAFTGMKNTVVGIWNGIWTAIKAVINFIISGMNFLIRGLNKIHFKLPNWVPGGIGGKGFGINIKEITPLAQGGFAKGTPQGSIVRVGDKNRDEAIIPLNKMGAAMGMPSMQKSGGMAMAGAGGNNVTIIVQGSVITERDLAEKIRTILVKTGKRAPKVGLA